MSTTEFSRLLPFAKKLPEESLTKCSGMADRSSTVLDCLGGMRQSKQSEGKSL